MPDLNLWLALSWTNHLHSEEAWTWFAQQEKGSFYFCRFTQLGLLRLLTTSSVMGEDVQTVGQAWKTYDRWLEDDRVRIWQESSTVESAFRVATLPISKQSSPKALGDRYLLALCQVAGTNLVTFDKGLASVCAAAKQQVTLLKTRRSLS